jgi:DNA repair protein RecO
VAVYRDTVTILQARDYGEGDRIITLFGRWQGKFAVIAKSVQKVTSRKRGHVQTFSITKVTCAEGKSLDILVEAESIFVLDTDGMDTPRYERLGFAAFVTKQFLAERVPEREIFDSWVRYITSDHSVEQTIEYVCLVLDRTGFLTDSRRETLITGDGKDLVRLRKYVDKVLETA